MNWNRYHKSLTSNPNNLRYDMYSFIKIVSTYFNITKFHEDCMIFKLQQTWDSQRDLYAKTVYEDVILGILLYTNEFDCKNDPMSVEDFVLSLYPKKDYRKHAIAIHKVYLTLRTIHVNNSV